MKKSILATMYILFCATSALAAEGDITVAGGGVVPVPAKGFKWEKQREIEEKPQPMVQIFAATKEGSTAKVVLVAEKTATENDRHKSALIKGNYNGMVESLKAQGYTELKGSKPPVEPPLPKQVSFVLNGKNKDGVTVHFHSVLVFGKSIYQFQVAAPTEAEAASLAKVAESIRE